MAKENTTSEENMIAILNVIISGLGVIIPGVIQLIEIMKRKGYMDAEQAAAYRIKLVNMTTEPYMIPDSERPKPYGTIPGDN